MNTCSGCGEPITWKYTESGKRMPLNPDPIAAPVAGSFRIEGERCLVAQPMFDPPGAQYFLSHWATCPNSELFRRSPDGGRAR